MPWELSIVNGKDQSKPLGERADVIARLAAALPGVVLQEAPGPDPEMIAQMPPSLREHFMRPRPLNADFEDGGRRSGIRVPETGLNLTAVRRAGLPDTALDRRNDAHDSKAGGCRAGQ
jgi:hypothetical protein